jgi:protease-4
MSLDADARIDRRRLKRRLALWRTVAVIAVVVAVLFSVRPDERLFVADHIARLTISGLILDDRERSQALAETATDPRVQALIVHINSPGGTVVGGEALYRDLLEVSANKPVVTVMREMTASAGYMVALGTDRIFARQSSITGSIGVMMQTTDVTGMLDKLGISMETLKSGPLKAVPNPFEPLSPEGREKTLEVIADIFDMFVGMVIERRGMSEEEVRKLADGRIFTGQQAAANGLIDEIGGEKEARAWLATVHGIDESLPVHEIEIPDEDGLWHGLFTTIAGKTLFSERVTLDGLISLWHPDFR